MAGLGFPFWKVITFGLYLVLYFIQCDALWDYPAENNYTVLFKLLPLVHCIFIILSCDVTCKGFPRYRTNIIIALLFSMAGDTCLVWRVSLFMPGLLFFAVAHVFYIRAFGLSPVGGGPTLTSFLIIAGFAYFMIVPGIKEGPEMYVLVFMYSSVIFVMTWRSCVCLQTWPSLGTFMACVGAILFSVSDFMIAYDKWQTTIENAPLLVMATYYSAQLLIALSAAGYSTRPTHGKED